ncbi:hypothetical protein, conserved [Eimeria praecox]|uniref:Uncharacterized protein n=1 Tax=Eimeria praecox TaxID=51316 RepID=U6H1U8_9EIME|nr:hypothetical protein, conserved [Eimeria praecox]
MEPVLAVDKRPSRASRLRTMFLSGTAHPKTAGIAVTSEPPIAFAGPKVLICRRRSTGSTPPASPLRAIQTAFHKIKNKRRKASDTASQQPQQQLPPLSMPTPPVETLSNTTEPLSDRPVQEQDLEAAPHHNEDNNNDDEHTKPEIPEPQNDSPAVSISPGMRGGFALPHDCPTIIEGEEWGSGECSDPEEIAPNPNRYTHAASTAHVPTAAASSADILQAATAHMQVPVRDVAVLQSCTPVAGEQHSCSGRRADWNWQTALTAPWQASKNKLSQLSRPFFDSTSQALQRDLNGTYKQAMQTATHGPAEALPAPPEGTPLSERRGDAPGQAKQRNPAAGHPRNPLGTQSSGQEQGPKERERSSVGSTSVIASFMERVVSVLEGSAALLSSCGTADMIDESQLVVSSGRVARSRHALPSSQSNSTTAIQSKAAPSLQVHRQQQPREMLEEGDLPDFHLVPADAKPTDAEKEQNQRCKSGEEAEWGDKSSGGKQRNKGRENEEKADKLPHFSEEPSGGNKQEDKEVSHCDTPSGSCLAKEQNVNGSLRSLYSSRWPKVSDRGEGRALMKEGEGGVKPYFFK